eukprot:1511499-Pleurochrysis_carterae.AAC.3
MHVQQCSRQHPLFWRYRARVIGFKLKAAKCMGQLQPMKGTGQNRPQHSSQWHTDGLPGSIAHIAKSRCGKNKQSPAHLTRIKKYA